MLLAGLAVFLVLTDGQCPLDCPSPRVERGRLPKGAPLAFESALFAGPANPDPTGTTNIGGFEPYLATDEEGVIYVADGFDRLLRSTDGGRSFLPLAAPVHENARSLGDVALLAIGERVWYAKTLATEGSDNAGLRIASSLDGGVTWRQEPPMLEGAPDRPWLAEVDGGLGMTWVDLQDHTTWMRRLGGEAKYVGEGFGYGNVVASSAGLVAASCSSLFLESVGRVSYPFELTVEMECTHLPMLASDPPTDRLDLAFVDREGRVCVARSQDGGRTWTRIVHCEHAALLGSTDRVPELWAVGQGHQTAVAWFEREADDLVLRVMRLDEDVVSLGSIAAGPIGPADAPANTDFPALAFLPDGRLVAAWTMTGGGTAVAVETPP